MQEVVSHYRFFVHTGAVNIISILLIFCCIAKKYISTYNWLFDLKVLDPNKKVFQQTTKVTSLNACDWTSSPCSVTGTFNLYSYRIVVWKSVGCPMKLTCSNICLIIIWYVVMIYYSIDICLIIIIMYMWSSHPITIEFLQLPQLVTKVC